MAGSERKTIDFELVEKREEKRLVTAIASVVTKTDGSQIVDSDGDIIDIEDLEQAFIEAFAEGGLRKGGDMHQRVGGADVVQHFTLSKNERIALGFGEGPEMGIVKFKVHDDMLWLKVKAGFLPELSIAGDAMRVPA